METKKKRFVNGDGKKKNKMYLGENGKRGEKEKHSK